MLEIRSFLNEFPISFQRNLHTVGSVKSNCSRFEVFGLIVTVLRKFLGFPALFLKFSRFYRVQ